MPKALIFSLLCLLGQLFLPRKSCQAQQVQIEKYYDWISNAEAFLSVIQPKLDTGLVCSFISMRYGVCWGPGCGYVAPGFGLMQLSNKGDSVRMVVDTGMHGGLSNIVETSSGYAGLVGEVIPYIFNKTHTRLNFYDRSLHRTNTVLLDSILTGHLVHWRDIFFSKDSGLYVYGYLTDNSSTGWDLVLARYHQQGFLEWVRDYKLPNSQESGYIMPDTGNCLLLCGTNRLGAGLVMGVKANGDVRFQKEFLLQPHRINTSVVRRLPDGGLLGCTSASDQDTSFLFRMDGRFNILWKKSALFFDGRALWTYTDGTGCIIKRTLSSYSLVKFNMVTGDSIWGNSIASRGIYPNNLNGFSYYSNGDAAIVGSSPELSNPLNAHDPFFLKIQGLGIPYNPDSGLVLATSPQLAASRQSLFAYPNPASSGLTVFCPEAGTLQLYDSRGAVVLERKVSRDEKVAVEVAALPKGLYVARVGARSVRVVVE